MKRVVLQLRPYNVTILLYLPERDSKDNPLWRRKKREELHIILVRRYFQPLIDLGWIPDNDKSKNGREVKRRCIIKNTVLF